MVKYNRSNSKKLWKIVNNIVSTKSTSSCKINGVLDEKGKIVTGLNRVTDLINKNFVKALGGVQHFFLQKLTLAFILKLKIHTTSQFLQN